MSDLISRQAAIDALKDWYDGMFISSFRGIEKVIDALPPVQPDPHWIPVTERMPEINEDILLSYFDEVTIGWLCGDGSWMIFDGQECASADEISAWMPLPEPYKEVTE